uniref:Uncharacterized protein n=1 Tax=Ditylenchus dipsaci TaxID=166011 RepID=A0A915DV91_9BILA
MPRVSYLKALDIWLQDTSIVAGHMIPMVKVSSNGTSDSNSPPSRPRTPKCSRQSSLTSGIGLGIGGLSTGIGQIIAHQAISRSNHCQYPQPPMSDLAANALNLPLTQSHLRFLQQQHLQQAQQQLQLQAQIQAQLLQAQTQLTSMTESDIEAMSEEAANKKLFFCLDQYGNIEFTPQFMRRFHWITQMSFFFGFVLFCLFFFLVYPNMRVTAIDPACEREHAEWFAPV